MSYNLFLDDVRKPTDCRHFPGDETPYDTEEWVVVKGFEEFESTIWELGLPKLISFDYQLEKNKDGLDCAKFLSDFCNRFNLKIPNYDVHSNWPGIYGKFIDILGKMK